MPSLLRKVKNKFRFVVVFSLLFAVSSGLFVSSADAAFFKKKNKKQKSEQVIELETSRYRVYYLVGGPEKKPELGAGDFCELQYKSVFQDEWVSDANRLIQIDFLDPAGYIAARDVVADKDFNSQGEHYGYLWVSCELAKTISNAEVKEVFQKNKVSEDSLPPKERPKRTPVLPGKFDRKKYFEEKSPELKEIFQKEVLTEKDIEQALSLTRSGGSASAAGGEGEEKPKAEGEDGEDVSIERSFA